MPHLCFISIINCSQIFEALTELGKKMLEGIFLQDVQFEIRGMKKSMFRVLGLENLLCCEQMS